MIIYYILTATGHPFGMLCVQCDDILGWRSVDLKGWLQLIEAQGRKPWDITYVYLKKKKCWMLDCVLGIVSFPESQSWIVSLKEGGFLNWFHFAVWSSPLITTGEHPAWTFLCTAKARVPTQLCSLSEPQDGRDTRFQFYFLSHLYSTNM